MRCMRSVHSVCSGLFVSLVVEGPCKTDSVRYAMARDFSCQGVVQQLGSFGPRASATPVTP
jgi:hypothetical protein